MKSTIKIILLSCLFLIIISIPAFSNMTIMEAIGGSARPQNGESTQISMDSEIIKIDLGENNYAVDVVFEFFNRGETTTEVIGFPKWRWGSVEGSKYFINFEGWVDGKKYNFQEVPGEKTITYEIVLDEKFTLKEKNHHVEMLNQPLNPSLKTSKALQDISALIKQGKDLNEITDKTSNEVFEGYLIEKQWLISKVVFRGHKKTTMRIKYISPYYGSPGLIERGAYYIYGTGKPWMGPIKKSTFIIKSPANIWFGGLSFSSVSSGEVQRSYTITKLSEHECEFYFNNLEPSADETLYAVASFEKEPWDLFFKTDSGLINNTSDLVQINFDFNKWLYTKELIPDDELKMLSLEQLKLLKGAFFAIHGKIIEDPEIQSYFEKQSWYSQQQISQTSNEEFLSDIEKENIKKIEKYMKGLK